MQVRLQIGRLTLGLTVADRWSVVRQLGFPPGAIRISTHHSE